MRGRTKLISLAAILAVIFVSSTIFASGAFDVSNMSVFSTPIYPDLTPSITFSPAAMIGDFINDPGYQVGDYIQVTVGIADAVGVFSYQVDVAYNPSILSFTSLVSYGTFLAGTSSPYGTSRTQPTYKADNTAGDVAVAETILGDYVGVSGAGTLFTVEFQILDYGCTTIGVGTGGELPTILLDNAGAQIAFTSTSGYFKNKLLGDANGDKAVNVLDMGTLSGRWTAPPGPLPYSRDVDNNDDGAINVLDMGVTSGNWGRSTP